MAKKSTVFQVDQLEAGSGVEELWVIVDFGPGFSTVGRFGDQYPVRWGAIIPHVSDQMTVRLLGKAGLDAPSSNNGFAEGPGIPPVVCDGHHGKGKTIRIEPNQHTLLIENFRVCPCKPSQAPGEFVIGLLEVVMGPLDHVWRELLMAQVGRRFLPYFVRKGITRFDVQDLFLIPDRRPISMIIFTDLIFHQCRFPQVGLDGGPEKPKAVIWIDDHATVGVGELRGIGHQKWLAP